MEKIYLYTIVSVVIVSVIALVGILTLAISKRFLNYIAHFLVSLAAGALLGDAFIHLLPEAIRETGFTLSLSLYVISGILIFFILEKFVRWRHCHMTDEDCGGALQHQQKHPFAYMTLVGDALHNFLDGIVIASSYLISIPIGIATTIAVILHEIPQELGDFGILVNGGFSRKKALLVNFYVALTAVLGAVVALVVGERLANAIPVFVAITVGGFVYIASADLIPELHKETRISHSLLELLFFISGIGLMVLMLYVG